MKSKIHEYKNKYLMMSKTTLTLLTIFFISISTFAQQGINYKALIKDDNGNTLINTNIIDVQFTIYEGADLINEVYYESRPNVSTDANGILIINIGEGVTNYDFSDISWGNDEHWLNVQIDIGDGLVDMGTTQFMAVPYAKYADTAANVSGLEQITEETSSGSGIFNTGWRIIGSYPGTHRPIGDNAVDLSYHFTLQPLGASGNYSTAIGHSTLASEDNATAMGLNTRASGFASTTMGAYTSASEFYSTAMGYFTEASGYHATAMGSNTKAESYISLAIGRFNEGGFTDNVGTDNDGNRYWVAEDPLFEIGNGTSDAARNNALTVLKNGTVITGGPLTIQDASDATSTWRLETRPNGSLSLYRNGSYRGFFSESTGNYSSISDRSTKKDITTLENGTLKKVMQLNPVSYIMKEQADTKRNLGLISQEVQEIFPSITNYVEEADLITLSYTELIPILIKALQEQQGIIDEQDKKIDELHTSNSSLKTTVNDLISRVEKIETNNK